MEAYALAAGVTATLTKLGEDIIGFFSGFSVAYAAEILLFYLLIYYVSKVLRDNDATRLMLVYWGVILVMGVMKYSVELFDTKFYFYFVLVLSMFMLILFNVEPKPVRERKWSAVFPISSKRFKICRKITWEL